MKKFLALLMAAMMLLATAGFAFAETVDYPNADSDSKTLVTNVSDHDFKYFQIFSGSQKEDSNILSNIMWGKDVGDQGAAILEAIMESKEVALFTVTVDDKELSVTASTTAAELAEILSAETNKAARAKTFAEILHGLYKESEGTALPKDGQTVQMDAGYYLIVDKTSLDGVDTFRNASLLQVTGEGNISVQVKTDKPDIEKKVEEIRLDNTLEDVKYGEDMNDTADYSIGDYVKFKLYSKVPNMDEFDTYKYKIVDNMSEGLTFVADDAHKAVLTIGNTSYEIVSNGENGYVFTPALPQDVTFSVSAGGETYISIDVKDLKKIATKDDDINFVYYAQLNENAVIGNPGNPNAVYLEYSNNPNDGGEGTGKTKTDYAVVFTYEVDVTKVENGNTSNKLDDAWFYLYKQADGDNISFAILNDGKVSGWTAPVAKGSIVVDAAGTLTTPAGASMLVTANGGQCTVKGLEDGTYYLLETKTPTAEYNKPSEAFKIVITADIDDYYNSYSQQTDGVKALSIKVGNQPEVNSTDEKMGIAEAEILNGKGATLPETGGIGTTLFYLLGGLMTAGSALMLVVRRRAESEEE